MEKEKQKSLRVYCHPQRGHRYGVQCQPKLWVDSEYAFYDRAVLQAGKKEVFVSVLLPHDSSVEPYDICRKKNEGGCLEPWARKHDLEGVKLEEEKTKGIVTELKTDGSVEVRFWKAVSIKDMIVCLDTDGSWKVKRGEQNTRGEG